MESLSRVQLFATPWTVAYQAPLSMGFSRQEYWSGLPFPSPGDLPDPGIEPMSLMSPALADRFFITSSAWGTLNGDKGEKLVNWHQAQIKTSLLKYLTAYLFIIVET